MNHGRLTAVVGIAGAGVALAMLAARFLYLGADPPTFFAPYGQSQLTDPYLYTWFARLAVLFDQNTAAAANRFAALRYSLVSGASYVVFSLLGVSRITANLTSILLSLGGIGLFCWGLARRLGRSAALVCLGLLLGNALLLIYSRMPYLENGLLFWSGLLTCIYFRFGDRGWGQVGAGAIVALAALTGKLFGAVLMVPLVVAANIDNRPRASGPVIKVLIGSGLGTAAYLALFFRYNLDGLLQYHSDLSSMYTSLPAFTSIERFLSMYALFGLDSGLMQFGITAVLLTIAAMLYFSLRRDRAQPTGGSAVLVYCAVWIVTMVLIAAPQEFRAVRYYLFLFFPGAALAAVMITDIQAAKRKLRFHLTPFTIIVASVVSLLFVAQLLGYLMYRQEVQTMNLPAVLIASAAVGVLVGAVIWRHRHQSVTISKRPVVWLVTLLLLWFGFDNVRLTVQTLAEPQYVLSRINREMPRLLGSQARLTGPWAPALTIDNDIRGEYNTLGNLPPDPDFFRNHTITHLVTDSANYLPTVRDYPDLQRNVRVFQRFVRNTSVSVYLLPSPGYRLSDYEQSLAWVQQGQYDSALAVLSRLQARHPENTQFAFIRAGLYLFRTGEIDNGVQVLTNLANRHPDDYAINYEVAGLFGRLHTESAYHGARALAVRYYSRAADLDPYLPASLDMILTGQ